MKALNKCKPLASPCVVPENRVERAERRRGFTLLELLIALSVVALLVAIAAPAILQSRAASHQIQCQNNLKQIGVAIANYESRFQAFPPGRLGVSTAWRGLLLADLDQKAMYDELMAIHHPDEAERHPFNKVAMPIFNCPGDWAPIQLESRTAAASYHGNCGTSLSPNYFPPGADLVLDGVLIDPYWRKKLPPVRAADLRDGASNTVMVSERLRGGRGSAIENDLRRMNPVELPRITFYYRIDVANQCRRIPKDFRAAGWRGVAYMPRWLEGFVGSALYTHTLPPNSASCSDGVVYLGIFSATSDHRDGVNCLYADGHVAMVASSVDAEVWRMLGCRNEALRR